jgi:PAS domain S-box-containing protein
LRRAPACGLATYLTGVAALAAACYLGAQFGVLLASDAGRIALIWPPAGIAVAALFRGGLWYWPGVFVGALACACEIYPWWAAAGIAAGRTVGSVIAVVVLERLNAEPLVGRRGLYAFLLAGTAGVTVSVSCAMVWWAAAGLPGGELFPTWLSWWLGDTAGLLIVAPLLLTATVPERNSARKVPALLVTAALSALAFTDLSAVQVRGLFVFPPFMMLIWVGMSNRLRVGSLHVVVLVAIAAVGTADGQGVFGRMPPMTRLLMVWALSTTAALTVLAMTTAMGEREQAETAFAAAAADFQALVDCTPAAILRYTADGTLTFVNATLCSLLGRPREMLIGRSVLDFIPEMPLKEQVTDLPLAAPATGPEAGVSGLIRTPDGSARWYRWTARHVPTAAGTEFQAVGIDLTERRQAEADRTALERKMQDSQRLEALGVLAGGVAHDFNNLLAGVMGHAELAAGTLPGDHPAREHLATVLSGVSRAGALTRQLLAYSGKGRFLLRPLDLNDVITQTTELLRLTLPKKVQLSLHLSPHLPPITGDDGQMRQVLMNLIINAGEAIGDRAGTVTVATAGHELLMEAVSGGVYSPAAPGRFVELVVSDNGCGMDEATKARLFDPFFTTKFAGRGLGMSAVLGIVRGHGGGIRVDSRPGVGTRFTVLLPIAPLPADPETPGPLAVPTPPLPPPRDRVGGSTPRPPKRRVDPPTPRPTPATPSRGLALVADDEPTVRRVGELMLSQAGFEVMTAENGAEAVAQFAANADRVRVVLLDLMMPVMDGTEALAAIRARSAVPVILCSGYTSEAVPPALAADGRTTFLQKPFARADLQRVLTAAGV